MLIHIVRPGETAYAIAARYGIAPWRLLSDNGLTPESPLAVGQALVVLFPAETYTVAAGDSLYSVAARYGTTVNALLRNNWYLGGRTAVSPGQELVIRYTAEKLRAMAVNAYAYPYINRALLTQTVPCLTYLTAFTYGIREDGSLVQLDDEALLEAARARGVAPLMHLSTLTEEGGFSNALAHLVLTDMKVQENLISNVLETLRRKGYAGLDVDFEFVYPGDREAYAGFLNNLHARLAAEGYPLFAALAPKTSDNQPGELYEAHDYALIGAAVDAVLLMTYEWGYTYGPPMAVAPIPSVRRVLDYALTRIPANKIYLGVPIYGYDWPLPFVAGETRAQSISSQWAVGLAARYKAEIQFDETAQSPFFTYTDAGGRIHEVWFEDARSIRSKLALVPEYGLLGVGYWNLMRPFPQNWQVLNALYDIESR